MAVLVSSRALSFFSPVFATMFSGRFAEGQRLSSLTPLQLPLPDDDPMAMLALCNIAHHRVPKLPSEDRHECFAQFAILCDKNNCVDAVRSQSRAWVLELAKSHPQFETLVFSTYILDLHEEFSRVTRTIILQRTSVKVSAILYQPCFLPTFALDCLQTKQKQAIEDGNNVLLQRIFELSSEFGACGYLAGAVQSVIRFLWIAKVWPHTTRSFQSIKKTLSATEPLNIGMLYCHNPMCRCRSLPAMQLQMLEMLEKIEKSVKGLCQVCIKAEDTGVVPGPCRMEH